MFAIETRGLTRNYGSLCAVDNLNLRIGTEIFGLLGPNGSGKTTTVLMLTTLLRPSEGEATVCGHDVVEEAGTVREKISYVPQDMAVDIKLTGRENVRLFAKLYGVPDREERIDEVLSVMDLSSRADDRVKTYSGGMRRRLELAQALVHEPEVLFLDEPTIGLDVAGRKKIWEHIASLRKSGMAIFVTTHYMDEADHSCDRVAILDRGRIVALDSPSQLKNRLRKDVIIARIGGEFPGEDTGAASYIGKKGDEYYFTADSGSEAVPQLVDEFRRKGLEVRSLAVREPSLDDVFLDAVETPEDNADFNDFRFRLMLRRRRG